MMALRTRRRGHGGGVAPVEEGGGGEGPPPGANAASSWGDSSVGKLVGGYTFLGYFPFPQGVVDMTDIAHIGASSSVTLFTKRDGTLWVAGNNSEVGTVGNGLDDIDVLKAVHIVGGVPLYPAELLTYNKGASTWHQPVGPIGPVLPPIVATSGGPGQLALALTNDGHVLAFGNGNEGQLGNGTDTKHTAVLFEKEGLWPQYAPNWVRTGGPILLPVKTAGEENGGAVTLAESKKLKEEGDAFALTGVSAIVAAEKLAYFLRTNGEVFFSGQVAGEATQHNFAAIDPVWAARPGGTPKAIAIAGTRYGYLLLLEDHTIRYVGVPIKNTDEGKETSVRGIENPGLSKVVAIAKGEYSWLALKDDGTLWVCGSNRQGGLGLGRALDKPSYTPTQMPSLPGTTATVLAIAANGVKEGNGSNNGDVFALVLSDGTIRTWGQNYTVGTGGGIQYLPWGTLGDGTSENRSSPVKPDIANVKAMTVNSTHMVALQEPATPPTPSLSAVVNGDGTMTVSWTPVTGAPAWRPAEKWQVKLVPAAGKVINSPSLPTGATSWTSPVLASGNWEVKVIETFVTQAMVITGGDLKTPVSGKLTVAWSAPAKAVRTLIAEVQYEGEDWQRTPPEISGAATSTSLDVPPSKVTGLVGAPVRVRLRESFEGSYKTRIMNRVLVP